MISILKKNLKSLMGKDILKIEIQNGDIFAQVKQNNILRVLSILESDSSLEFSRLVDCCANKIKSEIFLYYQIYSSKLNIKIFIWTCLTNVDLTQSITPLFKNANWFEREIYQEYDILFIDHPDLRTIL